MIRYDPETSNGHDACAISQEEFEEGEMVWRNSEDGPITALYKPEAIYRWLHTARLGEEDSGLWEDPVTRKVVPYEREANPTDGLLRWMSTKHATPIVIDADPKGLRYMPLFGMRSWKARPAGRPSGPEGPIRTRSYQWLYDVANAITPGKSCVQFDIQYANEETAHIHYEKGDLLRRGDDYRPPVYGPGTYYRLIGTRYGINAYRLFNMPGHLMSIGWMFHVKLQPVRELEALIKKAEQSQDEDKSVSCVRRTE